jgi:hypothetical protein
MEIPSYHLSTLPEKDRAMKGKSRRTSNGPFQESHSKSGKPQKIADFEACLGLAVEISLGYLKKWDDKWHQDGGKDLNIPKVPVKFVRKTGSLVYQSVTVQPILDCRERNTP